jgi:tetratricopeptide (TPR) repeat protein
MRTDLPSQTAATLCEQIYTLIAHKCLDEATTLLEQHLANEPLSNKGLLAWTRVQCARQNTDLAIERLTSPIKQFPTNPYFKLACLEIRLADKTIAHSQLITLYKNIELCAGEGPTELLADISAKIALSAALQGLWSTSILCFLKAIRLYAANDQFNPPENLILLYKRNEPSVQQFVSEIGFIEQHHGPAHIATIPLETIGRLLCILVTANELQIPEAGPVINHLTTWHPDLQQSNYSDLVTIAIKYSPGWIGLQLPYKFAQPIVVWN